MILLGEAQVEINGTKFAAAQGTQFFVPRGNQYQLWNNSAKECRLFFCHGKEIVTAQ